MIGVITLISVQERTKEIGILRAIGASKREVCSMFNAETIIIGLISGVFGVALTYILCIPINAVIHSLTGINNLSAFLPIPAANRSDSCQCSINVSVWFDPLPEALQRKIQ